jgi:integral membrane sensor domain MASE1
MNDIAIIYFSLIISYFIVSAINYEKNNKSQEDAYSILKLTINEGLNTITGLLGPVVGPFIFGIVCIITVVLFLLLCPFLPMYNLLKGNK